MNSFRKKLYELGLSMSERLPGGVHWGLNLPAKDKEWQNYLVLVPGDGFPMEEVSGDTTVESRDCRFQFYTDSLETSGELVEELYQRTRNMGEVLEDGNRIIGGKKISDTCMLDPNRWYDGSEIWIGLIVIDFTVQVSVVTI